MLRPYAWDQRLSGIFMFRCARCPVGHVGPMEVPWRNHPFPGLRMGWFGGEMSLPSKSMRSVRALHTPVRGEATDY